MIRLRKLIFWCHLPLGVIAGLIILIMSVTGTLLTYERQLTAWADARLYRIAAPSSTAHLNVEALVRGVRETEPAIPSTVTLRADPSAPAAIGLAGGRTIFVDPYTGAVLGEGSTGVRAFFRAVTGWHRWLGVQGEGRVAARVVTGACNLCFLFLVTSGFYLWWPRSWKWASVRNIIWFRKSPSMKARDFNWHNVIGFWSAIPLVVIVLSGVVISFPWASDLVYRIAGEAPPAARVPSGTQTGGAGVQGQTREGSRNDVAGELSLDGVDELWARAESQVEGWHSITLRLPGSKDAPVTFTIDQGNGGQPQRRSQLTFDRKAGQTALWEPFSSQSRGRRLRTLFRFAHTGEAAGLTGQTIAGLASAGVAVMVWTGLSLAWRRFRAWAARRGKQLPVIGQDSYVAEGPPLAGSEVAIQPDMQS